AQVLGNLLSNALRHTSPGGTGTVSAATYVSAVEVAVADDGEGFTKEDRSRLFERFFRADSSRTRENSRSGRRLTIGRALVERHGGSVAAVSERRGQGATFTIRRPRATADR